MLKRVPRPFPSSTAPVDCRTGVSMAIPRVMTNIYTLSHILTTKSFPSWDPLPTEHHVERNQFDNIEWHLEDHTLAPAYNPTADLSIYAAVDTFSITPICPGSTASALNFTIDFCSTNLSAAQAILHDSHVFDAVTLQEFLGNETFTGCSSVNGTSTMSSSPSGTGYPIGTGTGTVLSPTGTGSGSTGNGTSVGGGAGAGPTIPPTAFTGGAATPALSFGVVATAGLLLLLL
ncbi:MAG: hypothetical protein LQ350_002945 [Teloschistes chrysophthalmus]|nr:MAG: hypothetical protein LQ350_002945 [Niorma chrysophthalma]